MSKPRFIPRSYQRDAIRFILDRNGSGIFADPGLGKTGIVLSVVRILKKCRPGFKTLVIAPLPVVLNTWTEEVREWSDFEEIRVETLYGRNRVAAAKKDADVYLLNAENIFWLFDLLLSDFDEFPFDMLVLDESTLFKNWSSKRTKVLRKFRDLFDRVVLLTGTPTPNGLLDIFSQIFLIDGGESLGRFLTPFKERYFYATGYKNKELKPYDESEDLIRRRTSGTVLRIDRSDVYDMPLLNEVVVPVTLPPDVRRIYDEFESRLFAEMDGEEVLSPSRSVNYGICRQIAAGGLYKPEGVFIDPDAERVVYDTHKTKLDAVLRLSDELYGKPILLAYQFDFNREQFGRHSGLKKLVRTPFGTDKQKQLTKYKKEFLRGRIPILAVHPGSMSHGLNLHKGPGRSVVWLSPTNNLEHYIQFNERIYRPGVGSPVTVYILVAKDTIDEVVLEDLRSDRDDQRSFLNGLREYRNRKTKKK